jgi:ribosomal protein L7/L12/mono/diheme cytochrome c family protein
MNKQFWIGLLVGIIISGIVGGLFGLSMLGRKAVVPPSELEAHVVNYLKSLKIPEAAAPAVPIENNEKSLLEGGGHYNHHCAVCHDLEGDADSGFAEAFNPPVADLTSKEVQRYSDGQLKWIIDNGIRFTGMPGWKSIIDETTQWKIVYYMRVFADSEKAERLENELKARGKWKVEAPAGNHDHDEAAMHGDDDHSLSEPDGHHHDTDLQHHSKREEEKELKYDLYIKESGPDEIKVIKEVRAVTGLGLSDAKAIVDAAPAALKEDISMQEAEQIKARFSEIGATVEIK